MKYRIAARTIATLLAVAMLTACSSTPSTPRYSVPVGFSFAGYAADVQDADPGQFAEFCMEALYGGYSTEDLVKGVEMNYSADFARLGIYTPSPFESLLEAFLDIC